MWNTKENRIQVNSVWSCNGKDHGFSRGNLFKLGVPYDYFDTAFIYIVLCTISCGIASWYIDLRWCLYKSFDNLRARKKFLLLAKLAVVLAWVLIFILLRSTPGNILSWIGVSILLRLHINYLPNKLISVFRGFSVLINGFYAPGDKNSFFIMRSFVDEEIRGEVINLTPFEVTIKSENGTYTYPNHRIEYFSKVRFTHMDGVRIEVNGMDKEKVRERLKDVKGISLTLSLALILSVLFIFFAFIFSTHFQIPEITLPK